MRTGLLSPTGRTGPFCVTACACVTWLRRASAVALGLRLLAGLLGLAAGAGLDLVGAALGRHVGRSRLGLVRHRGRLGVARLGSLDFAALTRDARLVAGRSSRQRALGVRDLGVGTSIG